MKIKSIIVARTDRTEDLMLSIPSFYMLRKIYPNAEITVIVRKYNYEIVETLPYIDRVLKMDDYRQQELINKIKYFNADVFIALYSDSFVSKLAKASRAPWRVGPLLKLSSYFVYNKGVRQKRYRSQKNEAEYNLDIIKRLDPEVFKKRYEIDSRIYLKEKNKNVAEVFLRDNKIEGQILLVTPFTEGVVKNISDGEYAELLREIKRECPNLNIVVTCNISQEERGQTLIDSIGEHKIYLFANGGDLLNLGAIIDRSDVYLGGPTGSTYIAGSLKKRIVALYYSRNNYVKRWGVYENDERLDYVMFGSRHKSEKPEKNSIEPYLEEAKERVTVLLKKALKNS